MTTINIIVPAEPTGASATGSYDVTDYLAWQTDLVSTITAGSDLEPVKTHTGIVFIEVKA